MGDQGNSISEREVETAKTKASASSGNSNGSFGSSTSSQETCNSTSSLSSSCCRHIPVAPGLLAKPHKANNDARWAAIQAVQHRDGGAIRLSHFWILHRVGSGDIGSVYLAQLRGGDSSVEECYFALKVMDNSALCSRNKLARAQTEREILEVLDHPFLPTLYSHIQTERFSCLVMEFCPGGDLHDLRQHKPSKRFSETASRFYAAEVLVALEYLHMMGIVYRDLKPENVLVREDGHIMLSDFDLSLKCTTNPMLLRLASTSTTRGSGGGSCIIHPITSCLPCIPSLPGQSHGQSHGHGHGQRRLPEIVVEPVDLRSMSFVGTHEYLAPEIILGDGHGSAVDWWTFGIFLYELLYGCTPFKGPNNESTLTNIITEHLSFDPDEPLSVAAQNLISGLLVKDPQERLGSLRGATELKQHAFFQGVNWALVRCAIPPQIPSPFCTIPKPQSLVKVPHTTSPQASVTDLPHNTSSHIEYF